MVKFLTRCKINNLEFELIKFCEDCLGSVTIKVEPGAVEIHMGKGRGNWQMLRRAFEM